MQEDSSFPLESREPQSKQMTAKLAISILTQKNKGFLEPLPAQRKRLVRVFAGQDRIVYGKAFDIVKVEEGIVVDLDDDMEIEKAIKEKHLWLCEIKSTNKRNVGEEFENYFFALTTAELLVAQSLKEYYRFVFVNTITGNYKESTLPGLFAKAKAIYPTWSIRF